MSSEHAGGTPGPGAVSDRMRALLSRAAEEQLLEQRQVSAVLGELRTLVEDVDERLATGEQVERLTTEVRAVQERLDAAEARSAELAERISEATAMVGQAAQDLVEAVATRVNQRLEAQLRELTSGVVAAVEASERRLATHVDDAVLALAEVVLRRRRPALPETAPSGADVQAEPPAQPAEDEVAVAVRGDQDPGDQQQPETEPAHQPSSLDDLEPPDRPYAAGLGTDDPSPGDGFVLVPADVEQPDAGPPPPVPHERRTADRRTSARSDGSGRRRRPWWRPV